MFDRLIEHFLHFPGIGPRQAKRFVYFLARGDKKFIEDFSRDVLEITKGFKECDSCHGFFEFKSSELTTCSTCSSLNRDNSKLMIVEKDVDFENIEKTGVYDGKYFILGGTLPVSNDKKHDLKFRELFEKVKKDIPKEIIIATSATVEGENTARYIKKILEPITKKIPLKITKLGRGLSTSTELEYVDSDTISNALKNRK